MVFSFVYIFDVPPDISKSILWPWIVINSVIVCIFKIDFRFLQRVLNVFFFSALIFFFSFYLLFRRLFGFYRMYSIYWRWMVLCARVFVCLYFMYYVHVSPHISMKHLIRFVLINQNSWFYICIIHKIRLEYVYII